MQDDGMLESSEEYKKYMGSFEISIDLGWIC